MCKQELLLIDLLAFFGSTQVTLVRLSFFHHHPRSLMIRNKRAREKRYITDQGKVYDAIVAIDSRFGTIGEKNYVRRQTPLINALHAGICKCFNVLLYPEKEILNINGPPTRCQQCFHLSINIRVFLTADISESQINDFTVIAIYTRTMSSYVSNSKKYKFSIIMTSDAISSFSTHVLTWETIDAVSAIG